MVIVPESGTLATQVLSTGTESAWGQNNPQARPLATDGLDQVAAAGEGRSVSVRHRLLHCYLESTETLSSIAGPNILTQPDCCAAL
jgi:hypothetical protein